jgi:spermidine synthase
VSAPDPRPETLAREQTPSGEVALRRRGTVLELVVDGAFAMDTVDTSTEVVLATEALRRHPDPARVLVGGLGLGFTTRAVLEDRRVRHVDVVELAEPLVRWARRGLVPELSGLEGARCTVHVADVADVLAGRAGPAGPWDLVLLDVDNGPGFLVHTANAALYEGPGLAASRRALAPGGLLVVWSSHVAPGLLDALRAVAAPGEEVDEVVLPVHREGRDLDYALYLLRRGG